MQMLGKLLQSAGSQIDRNKAELLSNAIKPSRAPVKLTEPKLGPCQTLLHWDEMKCKESGVVNSNVAMMITAMATKC